MENTQKEKSNVESIKRVDFQTDTSINKQEELKQTKKKKKKNKSKNQLQTYICQEVDNSKYRLLNNWPECRDSKQNFPPEIPISQAYKDNNFPLGETCEYAVKRNCEDKQNLYEPQLHCLRQAAECHRQTRKFIQSVIKPDMKLIDICQLLEQKSKQLISAEGLQAGWGFPTGCSVNNVAAHYTPNTGDNLKITENDIVKFDFGVHVNGYLIDSAFTIAFDPKFDPLIKATQDGTNVGLKLAGVDTPFCDLGAAIQETIESYEMVVDGHMIPIKPISNLCGHSIEQYQIHGGKTVPIVKNSSNERMREGELYAIETFASTGRGICVSQGECSHYMREFNEKHVPLRLRSCKELLYCINKNFKTLGFCRRWLDDLGYNRHFMALKSLVDLGLVVPYPPLADIAGSYTSQMEHTVFLGSLRKEILSRGPDY